MSSLTLKLDFLSYWHAGTGRGSGHHLDALVIVDQHKLPHLPGKTLHGLLRDAVYRLEHWGSCPDLISKGTTEALFGSNGFVGEGSKAERREDTQPGCIYVSGAFLESDVADWLACDEGAKYRALLFREHFSTAINKFGVAKPKSLRGMQVTVPLQLEAEVSELVPENMPIRNWKEIIAAAVPMLRCAGANRSRGFGRCRISVKENKHA